MTEIFENSGKKFEETNNFKINQILRLHRTNRSSFTMLYNAL